MLTKANSANAGLVKANSANAELVKANSANAVRGTVMAVTVASAVNAASVLTSPQTLMATSISIAMAAPMSMVKRITMPISQRPAQSMRKQLLTL